VFDAIVEQELTAWPNMRRVIEMEQQWERFLFVKLLVKNARDVEDLCLHRNERVEEEVWVPSEQISDVGV
jgi:hypothetical protein